MRLRLSLSFLSLLLLTQPAQSSRPLSELYTFGVTRVGVGTVNGVSTHGNFPKQSVCQMFNLETLLQNSQHLTILNPDTSSLSKMVPLILSLKTDTFSVISMEEHRQAKRYEGEILRDFYHAQYHEFKFTSPSKVSGDDKIILPVQFYPGGMTIPYIMKILDILNMNNVIFLNLNDHVLSTIQKSSQSSFNSWHWTQDLPWAHRNPVPLDNAKGPKMTIYSHGKQVFDGLLTHSDSRVPGTEVLAPLIFEKTRSFLEPIKQPSLTHNFTGQVDKAAANKSRAQKNQAYHSSSFEVGSSKGIVYAPNHDHWCVYATGRFSYYFPNPTKKKQ